MKKKTTRQIFEYLPSEAYFKSVEKAAKTFRDMAQFADSLGFDDASNGFLALHPRHAPSGFEQEMPVCVFLKKLGFGVVLAEEFPHRKSADAEIDRIVFEIKQVAHTKNILRAIRRLFRTAYHFRCWRPRQQHPTLPIHGLKPCWGFVVGGDANNGMKTTSAVTQPLVTAARTIPESCITPSN